MWWRRIPRRWRLAIRIGLIAFTLGCLLLGGLVAYAAMTLPDINSIGARTGTVRILDRNGKEIAEFGQGSGVSRHDVTIDQISPVMRNAMIAAEDRNFYDEGAFNIPRVLKALFVDVIARRPAQGASTITQQLAKQAFFGSDASKSPLRKLREALLANAIDRRYSKDEILDKYLNLVYFGHGAYGIQNAAQTYFGKDAKDLNLQEASLLAGLPQAPATYDPYQNPQAAFVRQHYVLSGLVAIQDRSGVTQQQADAVDPLNSDPATAQANQNALLNEIHTKGKPEAGITGPAPHFAEYVREQIQEQYADDPAVTEGNITVQTTLDLTIQAQAVSAVQNGIAKLQRLNANNGALMMLDSRNGDVIAFVGSADFTNDTIGGQFDVVTADRRPGSSFKPYVYETGFKNGTLKPGTILDDTAAESAKLGNVHDFDNRFLGKITASRSLLLSRNVSTEQAGTQVGISNVIDFAHSLGITSDLADNASTAIGASSVKMIQHAAAYGAFSRYGTTVQPRVILKITDSNQNTLVDNTGDNPHGDQVMTDADAYTITKILRGYNHQWSVPIRHDVACKSGTTDSFVDAWYMCYTPNFVVATWAGHTEANNPGEIGMNGVFGTTVGIDITAPFINSLPSSWFAPWREIAVDTSCDTSALSGQSVTTVEGCTLTTSSSSSSTSTSTSTTSTPPTTVPLPSITFSTTTAPRTTSTTAATTAATQGAATTTAAAGGGAGPPGG